MRSVRSGSARLAVYESGAPDRPTVLLVHGYPDDHHVWDRVAQRLRGKFHVVTYDTRGTGTSAGPKERSGYRLEHLGEDLLAVADAVSPNQPVHVVGHDWGSIQAWEAVTDPAARHRIASYTTISGPCLDHVGHWTRSRLRRPTPRRLRQVISQQLHSLYILFFHLPVLPALLWRTVLARNWARRLWRTEGIKFDRPTRVLAKDGVLGMELYRANILPRLKNPRERRTTVPVQAITPLHDRYVTPALAEDLERWAPELWRRPLAAGHWAPLSHPEAVARMVEEFVDHVETGTSTRALRQHRVSENRKPFADKLIVITGAGSGIGRATAEAFAEQGADVIACDINEVAAKDTVRRMGSGAAYQVDVSDEAAMRRFADTVLADHGIPDIVVNNAGIGVAGPFLDTSTEQWKRVLDVNLWGVIHGCRFFGAAMAERAEGGHIVNVASAAAYTPTQVLPAYATTKSAVLMLSECLRAELAHNGIGVSAICPGLINTNIAATTTYVGASDAEQAAFRERAVQSYQARNYPPERVAAQILRAVLRNAPLVPVNAEARVAFALSKVSPGALRAFAKLTPPSEEQEGRA
ncbi:SDR family oxidoreductase [Allokutzneria sp. NRRL B-24872]|uniref:SDR family oxidoreductase n=1 Tax=Allokutzneria sp. NRRL B-24872 TaxID=1137961 RepID=UPI000A3D1983|nr:SDR family oxidoreductase [Allokutzneria sp. NRRL B-24872]